MIFFKQCKHCMQSKSVIVEGSADVRDKWLSAWIVVLVLVLFITTVWCPEKRNYNAVYHLPDASSESNLWLRWLEILPAFCTHHCKCSGGKEAQQLKEDLFTPVSQLLPSLSYMRNNIQYVIRVKGIICIFRNKLTWQY